MTLAEFLNKIPKKGWRMYSGGRIRRGREAMLDKQCPITAVYGKAKFGNGVPVKAFKFAAAAKKMGLDATLAVSIANAADYTPEYLEDSSRIIRTMLLERVGLEEKKAKKKRSS